MPYALDPVLPYAASYTLGAIFLAGAHAKWRERHVFVAVVQAYGLLPVPLVTVFSFCVMLAEFGVGLALWWPPLWPVAQLAGVALLAVVTGAVGVNLLRGRTDIDCGCGGASGDQQLSWALVGRNAVLALFLAAAASPAAARDLQWLDYGTIAFATAIGFALYAAVNQLLANRPRLASLELS